MNVVTGVESTELFGGAAQPAIRHLVEQARSVPREQAAAVLWTAAASAPDGLPVYYLLYKLHASLGELAPAARAAAMGLNAATRAAGLAHAWRDVQPRDADFSAPGPARFWLFTLKALAFIHLRQGDRAEAAEMLAHIRRLDPTDMIGAAVVERLLKASG